MTDGTPSGTQLLKTWTHFPGFNADTFPYGLTAVGSSVDLDGPDGLLWQSGGSVESTQSTGVTLGAIYQFNFDPGATSSPLCAAGSTLYFSFDDGIHGNELWRLNNRPVANTDAYTADQDSALTVPAAAGVLANDTDADPNDVPYLTASVVTGPSHGTLTFNPDGSFTYTPAAGYVGPDSFTYQASDGIDPSNVATVSLTVQSLQVALDGLSTGGSLTVQTNTSQQAHDVIAAANALDPATTPASTLVVDLGGQTIQDTTVNVPPQVTVQFVNGTFIGGSPALIVSSGVVIVKNSTFQNATDAPTILVTGGSLTLRGDTIQESTGYADAAIAITGGTVDLGTVSDPGGNTINVNGAGSLVSSTAPAAVSAVGNTFQNNGTVINPFNTTTVTASANPSLLNQSVTFTATVRPPVAGNTPTGTVQFQIDGANAGVPVALSNGSASFTTSTLPLGPHTITALYSGDGFYLGSNGSLSQSVQYKFSGFLPPLGNGLTFAVNRTIPIKFTLSDYNGNAITSLSAVTSLQIQALNANGNPVVAPFNPTPTGSTGLSNSGGQYQFNWQTKGLSAGSYQIVLTLADGTTQIKKLQLTAGGNSAGLVTGSSGGTSTAGALLGGEVDLYVDNGNGDLTSDELARIQDAVIAIDATIAPFGVTIHPVGDPTQANVILNMAATSALGGVTQGVLGCTTDADQVTMIQGWNWYAGSDATQVGSGQYDFETAVMHELGHVLGLGHSSEATSVMYSTLAPGTSDRTLTAADLNVSDTDSGPSALQAGVMASLSAASRSPAGSVGIASSAPLSAVDQLLSSSDLGRLLTDMLHVYQAELSSLLSAWQQADALFVQRFDALLSMGNGALKRDMPWLNSV